MNLIQGDDDDQSWGADLLGTSGDDYYDALAGHDWMQGSAGSDTMDGGSGFDVVFYSWFINDGDEFDWVQINLTSSVRGSLSPYTVLKSNGLVDTLISVEAVHATNGDDLIYFEGDGYLFDSAGDDKIYLYDGSAVILGLGNDKVYGDGSAQIWLNDTENGVNVLFTRQGSGRIYDYSAGTMDTFRGIGSVQGTLQSDNFFGSAGNEWISALDGDDYIAGGAGNDTLDGGDGDDEIDAGSGVNFVEGGAGDDTYLFGYEGVTTVSDSEGSSWIVCEADPTGYFQSMHIDENNSLIINGTNGSQLVFMAYESLSGITWMPLNSGGYDVNIEDVHIGTLGADTLTTNNGTYAEAYGADGNDVITIDTSDGSWVSGDGGSDSIYGGSGNDKLSGDFRDSNYGADLIMGNGGDDLIYGNAGNDSLHGGSGNDIVEGGDGADSIVGDANNDTLDGGAGNDSMNGGTGNDSLAGGSEKDLLTGGSGNDTFIFNAVAESAKTATTSDVISDFVRGQDKINLSSVDAFESSGVNDTFVWKGAAAFSSTTQGEVRYQQFNNSGTANDYTMIWIDNDADIGVEMAIRMTGLYTLTASDFIL